MSGLVSFGSAWEAEVHSKKRSPVYGYVAETLSSSMVQSAALGNFRKELGFSSPDLIMAVGSSISLFSLDAPGMTMAAVCKTPVFTNILSVECLQPPAEHHRSFAEAGSAGSQTSDVCIVLEEGGQLALLRIEEADRRHRLRTLEKTKVFADLPTEGKSPMLHKAVVDPLSRAVAVVSWISHIELLLTNWIPQPLAQGADSPQSSSVFHSRIYIDTDGAICDAAILSPLRSEMQRILLVAVVVEKATRHVNLHLYESWVPGASHSHPPSLVAKLPLPYSMSTPMHIVPLPDHRECFLLINECEVAFASAPQILSGDVNIYHQPIPRLPNGQPDLVKAYCVAGTKAVPMHQLSETRRPSEPLLSSANLVQKVYITTQRGALYCVQASSRPYISITQVSSKQGATSGAGVGLILSSESMLFLGSHSHKRYRNADSTEPAPDYLFVGGECADHRIVRVAEDSSWREPGLWTRRASADSSDPASYADSLVWNSRQVLVNQSPMSDFVVLPEASYWTSGSLPNGAVNRAQFGHGVRIEETIALANTEAVDTGITPTRLWSFALPAIASSRPAPCVVLQEAESYIPIIRDVDGEWQLMPLFQELVEDKQLVFVGSVGSDRDVEGCHVVCVDRESAFLLRSSAIALAIPEPSSPVTVLRARSGEVFTHGGLLPMLDSSADGANGHWALLVAVRTDQIKSLLRIKPIPAAEIGDLQVERGSDGDSTVELEFPHEISCMRVVSAGEKRLVLVGTYEPRLYVFQLDSCAESGKNNIGASLVFVVDIEEHLVGRDRAIWPDSAEDADGLSGVVASDAYMLCSADRQFLLIGLRDGSMIQLAVSGMHASKHSSELIDVGLVPIVFTELSTTSYEEMSRKEGEPDPKSCTEILRVLVHCQSLFLASISPVQTVSITLCALCDGRPMPEVGQIVPAPAAWYEDRYAHMALIDDARHAVFCLSADTTGSVSLLSIDAAPRCHVHEIPIGAEPRRIISDKETGLLLVASTVPALPQSGSLFPTSSLKAVDARDGHIHAEAQFDPYELVHSLEMWHIKGQKSYRYICVGTGQYSESNPSSQGSQAGPRAVGGRLVIYSLKAAKRKSRTKAEKSGRKQKQQQLDVAGGTVSGGYELRYVWESKRSTPVRALAHLGDSYLILASGTLCVVLKLDVVQKQLIECCEVELRFPATSIDVRGSDVVVGSSRETVHVFRFIPPAEDSSGAESLQMVHSARFGVDTADARCLASDLVVGVDRSGYLYAVGVPRESREFALDFVMGIHLGTECTRVKVGSPIRRLNCAQHVVPWNRSNDMRSASEKPASRRLPVEPVIISTIAGALWSLIRISKDAFYVLRELEQTMLDMESGHPARPLMLAAKCINRRQLDAGSQLLSENIVDGSLSRMFLESLTDAEQAQVLDRNPNVERLAQRLFGGSAQHAASSLSTLESVRLLIYSLNSACTC